MHHHARRPALGIKHIKNVLVSVAIMDNEGFIEGMREGDVRRECVPLHGATSSIRCSEIVQPGLPNCPDARVLGQPLHQLERRHQVRAHAGCIVWVDCDPGDHRWPTLGSLDGPAAAFGITSDLHDSGDADLSGQADGVFGIQTGLGLRRVEVAMRVHHWCR